MIGSWRVVGCAECPQRQELGLSDLAKSARLAMDRNNVIAKIQRPRDHSDMLSLTNPYVNAASSTASTAPVIFISRGVITLHSLLRALFQVILNTASR